MCLRYAQAQCCVCRRYLEQSSNRIIVEICGHQKCRECFIKEEDGCSLCVKVNQQFSSDQEIPSIAEYDKDAAKTDLIVESPPVTAEVKEATSHITTINIGNAVRYKCEICHKTFKSRNNRKYHLFCDKTQSKPFHCNQCDKQFITAAHMNYHQGTHNPEKQFECTQCQKVYSGEIALKKHIRKSFN